jgi:broad specificity phosphatase PhoE
MVTEFFSLSSLRCRLGIWVLSLVFSFHLSFGASSRNNNVEPTAVAVLTSYNKLHGGSMEAAVDEGLSGSTKILAQSFTPVVTVRFFLIRHGETIANNQGLVVGQWDSPLSEKGQEQATALGESQMIKSTIFWRKYCSDLGRTQETAKLILADDSNTSDWILDVRIREIAKGARQEYPKSWQYERAMLERQRVGKELPLLETSEDAWRRISDFLASVLEDANVEFAGKNDATVAAVASSSPVTVNVLVVSHAGALRTLLQRMAPQANPALHHQDDPRQPPDDQKRLQIPNTSVTILEVRPKTDFWRHNGQDRGHPKQHQQLWPIDAFFPTPGVVDPDGNSIEKHRLAMIQQRYQDLWDTHVVEFMWTRHLDTAISTNNDE